jgi:hypothetical protein
MTARSCRTRGPHEVSRGRQWRTMTAGGEAHRAGDEAAVAATLRWPVVIRSVCGGWRGGARGLLGKEEKGEKRSGGDGAVALL